MLNKIDALSEQNQQLTTENQQLRETLDNLKHKLFGKERDETKKSSNNKRKRNKKINLNLKQRQEDTKKIKIFLLTPPLITPLNN